MAEVHWASWTEDIEGILEKIQKTRTRVLFFEYDYPDIVRLSWLQQIKLRHRRMTEAVRLLKNPSASVTDVCYTVGFRDLSYFTRTFRRYVGMTPSRYKTDLEALHTSLPSPPLRSQLG